MSNQISSQNQQILSHLRAGKHISQMDAYDLFGCTRLSARIYDLRKMMDDYATGESIESVMVSFTTRLGKPGHYCRYYLKTPEKKKHVIHITDHAYQRAKERLSWGKETIERMAKKAYFEGIKHKDTKGKLNKYITSLWSERKTANNIRIYGENIYLFSRNVLLTVYHLDAKMRKTLKHSLPKG